MTTSTRDSHEIIMIQPELNRCEESIGESMTTYYSGEESMTTYYSGEAERMMTEENRHELWKAFIEKETKKLNLKYYQEQTVTMSIFQLPAYATSITPRSVSFGPFHHGEQNLKFSEYWKQMAVLKFISRTKQSLEHLMGEMRKAMEELQAHYALLEDKWRNDTEFVKLMIWDGCFMLELLRTDPSTSFIYDPHFGGHRGQGCRLPPRVWDVLLLDNQLPLLVIKVLLQIEAAARIQTPPLKDIDQEINNLVFKLLGMMDMHDTTPSLGLHILDLCRKGMIGPLTCATRNNNELPERKSRDLPLLTTCITSMGWLFKTIKGMIQTKQPASSDNPASPSPGRAQESHASTSSPQVESRQMFSAVKLHESGVAFMKSPTNTIRDISFDKDKGILMLPSLNIDEATESTFLSLMLFELLHLMPQGDLLRKGHELADTLSELLEQFPQVLEQGRRQLGEQSQSKLNIPHEIQSLVQSKLNIPDVIQSLVQRQGQSEPNIFSDQIQRQILPNIFLIGQVASRPEINLEIVEDYNTMCNELHDKVYTEVHSQINQLREIMNEEVLDQAFKEALQKGLQETYSHFLKQLHMELHEHLNKLSERQAQGCDQDVVSYIFFMRDLIDSKCDVHFLKSKKIIFVDVESEQAVAQLLKRLTERIPYISTSEIAEIRRDVNEYSKKNVTRLSFRLNKVSTSLKRRVYRWSEILMNLYFDNPWSSMGVIGGVILLVLTCLQTYYSFLSYEHPKDKN